MKSKAFKSIVLTTFLMATMLLFLSAAAGTQWPWPLGGHDLDRTGYTTAPGPTTNDIIWVTNTGSDIRGGPAIVDGIVYIGSDDNDLYALDMATGAVLWSYTTGSDVRSRPAVYNGDGDGDDEVYFGSRDGVVYCVTAGPGGGALEWSYSALDKLVSPTGENGIRGSPACFNNGTDDLCIIGSRDSYLYCLDAGTGAQIWNVSLGDDIRGGPAVCNNGTHWLVFQGSDNNNLVCIDANGGAVLWNVGVGGDVYRSPVIYNNIVYVGVKGKGVKGYDFAGSLVSTYVGPSNQRGGLAVADGKMVATGVDNGVIHCIDLATNTTAWTYTEPSTGSDYCIPVISEGGSKIVYAIDYNGYIYALDLASGTELWSYDTGTKSDEASGAVADGRLIIGSGDDNVYCFRAPVYVEINEICGEPPQQGFDEFDYEWIEIINTGTSAVDVSGWRLTDGENNWTVPALTPALNQWDCFVFDVSVHNDSVLVLEAGDNGTINFAGATEGPISLYDDTGVLVEQVSYYRSYTYQTVRQIYDGVYDLWECTPGPTAHGGSKGLPNHVKSGDLKINEFATALSVSANEFIEIYNPTGSPAGDANWQIRFRYYTPLTNLTGPIAAGAHEIYNKSMTNSYGDLAIMNPQGQTVDRVQYNYYYNEEDGTTTSHYPYELAAAAAGKSWERIPAGKDSDMDSDDFIAGDPTPCTLLERPPGVGGEITPIEKLLMLMPWIGLASAIAIGAATTAIIFKKRRL